jgi:predicted metal-dependent peptidase
MNLVVKSRIKLLQQQPFFGRLALLLTINETERIPTLCTDGEVLHYNKEYVKSLDEPQRMAAVLHEVLHVALGHLWRRGGRYPHLWNYATDYVINGLLVRNKLSLPTGGLHNAKYDGMNAEQVYDILKKSAKEMDCGFHMQIDLDSQDDGDDQKGQGDGDTQDQDENGEGQGEGKPSDKKEPSKGKGKQKSDQPGCDVCKAHQMWDKVKANPKKAKAIERRFEATMEDIVRTRGTAPAGFESIVEALKPKEDWKKILMSYLSSSKSDYDMMRRDRRTLDWDFYFPDLQDEQKLENIVVAVDTSGSISDEELGIFLGEMKEILRLYPHTKGWLIECDAQVHQCIDLNEAKKPKIQFYGRGGTSHLPVFAEVEKKELKPKVLIAFTDLYTDFPQRHPNYPVLWLATPGSREDNVPFGRVIHMKERLNERG